MGRFYLHRQGVSVKVAQRVFLENDCCRYSETLSLDFQIEAALETRVAAFEDCGTLTAASASAGAINLLGGKMRWVRAVVRGWDLESESGLLQR